jgi:hypothetical protein
MTGRRWGAWCEAPSPAGDAGAGVRAGRFDRPLDGRVVAGPPVGGRRHRAAAAGLNAAKGARIGRDRVDAVRGVCAAD